VKFYSRHALHTHDKEFICIWNKTTPEFKSVEKTFNKLNFVDLHYLIRNEEKSDRGNPQIAYGYAHMNVNGRDDESHLNKHQIKKRFR
jgi:hypothetical protein